MWMKGLIWFLQVKCKHAPLPAACDLDTRVSCHDPGPCAAYLWPPLEPQASDSRRINVALYAWKRFQSGVKQTNLNEPEVKFSNVLCLINAIFCWRADAGFYVDLSSFRCLFCHLVENGRNWLFSYCKHTVHTFKLLTCWIYLLCPHIDFIILLNQLDLD